MNWRVFLPAGTDQQTAELAAGVLALRLAAALGLRHPVVAGDSASALGAMRRLSCGAWQPGRAALLQGLAVAILRTDVGASLAYCPGDQNPADSPSRAPGTAVLLPALSPALQDARARAEVCILSPASVFRNRAAC